MASGGSSLGSAPALPCSVPFAHPAAPNAEGCLGLSLFIITRATVDSPKLSWVHRWAWGGLVRWWASPATAAAPSCIPFLRSHQSFLLCYAGRGSPGG